MTPEIIGAIASGVTVIIGVFFGFTKWIVNKFLSELRPNSGSSIKDKVEINSAKLQKIEERVDNIYEILAKRGRK